MVLLICQSWSDSGCRGSKFVAVEDNHGIVRLLCAECGKQVYVLYNEFYVGDAVRRGREASFEETAEGGTSTGSNNSARQ